MMGLLNQAQLEQEGFRFGYRGAHSSRTMMLPDLITVFDACPARASRQSIKAEVIDNNLIGKATASTRLESFERLSALYLLYPSKAMYRALRWYWGQDPESRPQLALLTAIARDPLLRATADSILSMPIGGIYEKATIIDAVATVDPDHFKPSILNKIATNAGASWTQAGYLMGRARKVRIQQPLPYAAVAYALYLGHLEGYSGDRLFTTRWTKVLGHPRDGIELAAQEAAARHSIDYRRAGSVREITFAAFDAAQGTAHGQG